MAWSLNGKVLIVTGASAGIGAATAMEAARHGMRIVLAARRREKLEAIAQAVHAAGGQAATIATDVADPDQVQAMIDHALEQFGGLDAMFANAGFGAFQHGIDAGQAEVEQRMWAVNYFGAVHCARAAGRAMIARGVGGHILFCSSVAASTGLPYKATYSATKAALHGFAASLRVELEGHRIHVSSVYPGATDTEFSEVAHGHAAAGVPRPRTPRGMNQSAEHVARRVVACLRRPCPEVWPSRAAHLAAVVTTLFPSLRAALFRRHVEASRLGTPYDAPPSSRT